MHFTISKFFYALSALGLLALGFDLWNPHGDTDWFLVCIGFVPVGLFFEGVGPSHTVFEHNHT